MKTRARMPLTEAFRQALLCVPEPELRGLIDTVVAEVLPFDEVQRIVSESPRRTRTAIVRAHREGGVTAREDSASS
ncbi:MAG TPA: hypothetical protein VGC45_05755 [Gryllotalpicola sp.]